MACRSENDEDDYVLPPPDPKVIHLFVTGRRADELGLLSLFCLGFLP